MANKWALAPSEYTIIGFFFWHNFSDLREHPLVAINRQTSSDPGILRLGRFRFGDGEGLVGGRWGGGGGGGEAGGKLPNFADWKPT